MTAAAKRCTAAAPCRYDPPHAALPRRHVLPSRGRRNHTGSGRVAPSRKLAFEPLEPRHLLDGANAALELFSLQPALFVENQGQWADQSVRFVHNGNGVNVAATDSGLSFQLLRRQALEPAQPDPDAELLPRLPGRRFEAENFVTQAMQFAVGFVGAASVAPVGRERSETVFNYFVGPQEDWRSAVPAYQKVVYEDLYAGIDLWTWGLRSHLKYEFHVAPGADYRQIQIRYQGIEGLWLAEDGSLRVSLGAGWGELVDDAPHIYQLVDGRQVDVAGRFVLLDGRSYGFELTGPYDPALPLVIDPELAWSTYLGGHGREVGCGVAVDAAGNVLVSGYTESSGWVSGGFDTSHNGSYDAFVVKLSAAGTHVWSTYLGGADLDQGWGVAVDAAGNVLVTGRTWSHGWVSGGFDTSHNGGPDAFVVKLSPSGGHLWSTYLGGDNWDAAYGVAVDAAGNVLVTGYTESSGWVSGGFDTSYNYRGDAFVVKLSPSGTHLWSTYLGGDNLDAGYGVAVDAAGNVLVTGETMSSGWVSGGFDTSYNGKADAFVVKLSPSGRHLWSTYLGGVTLDEAYGVAVDAAGNVLVTGYTESSGWVSGGFDTRFNGERDPFVVKLSSSGGHIWSTYLGGSHYDRGYGLAVDAAGNVLVTGTTGSSGWVSGGFDTIHNGGLDGFVVKLSPSGTHLWSTYLGGSADDYAVGVAVDAAGNVLVGGYTLSSGWVSGGFDTSFNGTSDAFVVKITGLGEPPDVGDTLSGAAFLGTLASGAPLVVWEQIGNGPRAAKDVDLYKFTLSQLGTVTLDVDAQSLGSALDSYLRLFNWSGVELKANDDHDGLDSYLSELLAPGTYYVGVSGYPNRAYSPTVSGSGTQASSAGAYRLTVTWSPPAGGWSPLIAAAANYDGNPDPAVFGRYLTGSVVPDVHTTFTVSVSAPAGYTTRAVCFDANFNGVRDAGDWTDGTAGNGWTWTLNVSRLDGDKTLRIWAQETGGAWSEPAIFRIHTLAAPSWMEPELTRIEFNSSLARYEIDTLIGQRFGADTPAAFPDWLEYRDGKKTWNGVYAGVSVQAYSKLSGKVVTQSVAPVMGLSFLGVDLPLKINLGSKFEVTLDVLRLVDLYRDPTGYFSANHDHRVMGFYDQRPTVPQVTVSYECHVDLDDQLRFTQFEASLGAKLSAAGSLFELETPAVVFPIPPAPFIQLVLTPHVAWSPFFSINCAMNLNASREPRFQTASITVGARGEIGVKGEVAIVGGMARGGVDVTGSLSLEFNASYDRDWVYSIPISLGVDIDFVGSILWGMLSGRINVYEWQWSGNLWQSGFMGLASGGLGPLGDGDSAPLLVEAAVGRSPTGEAAYAWTNISIDGAASPLNVQLYSDGAWHSVEQVVGSNHHRGNPAIAALDGDRWILLWSESNLPADALSGLTGDQIAAEQEIWYAIRDAGGWGAPVRLTANGVCDDSPQVTRLSDGSLIAAWRQMTGTDNTLISASNLVWAKWNGAEWSAPAVLADSDERLSQVSLAPLSDGRAVAVWLSDNSASGTGVSVFASVFDGTGWGVAVPISGPQAGVRDWPRVVGLADGRAVAFWTEKNSAGTVLLSAVRSAMTGEWSVPEAAIARQPLIAKPEPVAHGTTVRVVYHGYGQENEIGVISRDFSQAESVWTTPKLFTDQPGEAWWATAFVGSGNDFVVRYVLDATLEDGALAALPDLSIGSSGISLAVAPGAGVANRVLATVRNNGLAASGSTTAALYKGDPAGGGTLLATEALPALAIGAETIVEFEWTPDAPGQFALYIKADNDSAVLELDEKNNTANAVVIVLPHPSLTLDPLSDTGLPGDGWTADRTPTLRGTTMPGTTVLIYVDSFDVPWAQATVTGADYSVTLRELPDGLHTIWAKAIDMLGNASPLSEPLVLGIEPCPPLVEGTDGDDTIRLVRNAADPSKADVFVNNPGPAPTKTIGIDELWQWIISGGQGNDRLEVDLSLGSLLPVGGLVFDGGEGHDTLVVVGASADDDLRLTTSQVLAAGRPPIDYSRLESFAFRLGTGNDALTVDGTTATLVEPLSAAAVSVVNSGQLQAPSITAETVSVGAGAVLRFASSAAGGGGAQSGLPVDGPGTAASHTFQQQQFAEPAAEAATATTAAADWLGPTIEYAVAAQPPATCAGPVEVPAAVDGAQDIGLLSARGQPTAAAVEAIDAVVADWADQLAAEMLDGASTAQVEVDVDQPCVPAATLPTVPSQPADTLLTAVSPQPAETLPMAMSSQPAVTPATVLSSQPAAMLTTAPSPQPAAEAHRLVLGLLAEEVFEAERFWAIWQWQQLWQPPGGKRKSPVGAAAPQPAADGAADWLAA